MEGEGGDVHDVANFPPLDYQEVGENLCVMPTLDGLVANPDDEAHATVSSNVSCLFINYFTWNSMLTDRSFAKTITSDRCLSFRFTHPDYNDDFDITPT